MRIQIQVYNLDTGNELHEWVIYNINTPENISGTSECKHDRWTVRQRDGQQRDPIVEPKQLGPLQIVTSDLWPHNEFRNYRFRKKILCMETYPEKCLIILEKYLHI